MLDYAEAIFSQIVVEDSLDIYLYKFSFVVDLGRPVVGCEAVLEFPGVLRGLLASQLET